MRNKLSKHYNWPEQSNDLQDKILNFVSVSYSIPRDRDQNIVGFLKGIFKHPELALVCTMVLGIWCGGLTLPQNNAVQNNTVSGLYYGSSSMFGMQTGVGMGRIYD